MELYFAILLAVVFSLFFMLSFFWERKHAKAYKARCKENVYHCLKCSALYTSHAEGESAVCPVCSYRNGRLKF